MYVCIEGGTRRREGAQSHSAWTCKSTDHDASSRTGGRSGGEEGQAGSGGGRGRDIGGSLAFVTHK